MIRRFYEKCKRIQAADCADAHFIVGEAVIETFIPFITANLVNRIKAGADMSYILETGGVLALMACASLACGGLAGFTCAKAPGGLRQKPARRYIPQGADLYI